jgi:hypothetical protein
VTAHLDLGRNNTLFIRGKGGGLTWYKGEALKCVDPETWVWSSEFANDKLEFQLLLNDEVWEKGEPHVLAAGDTIEVTPDFEWPEIPRIAPAISAGLNHR